jgi:UDPglucose--hexose-1-phosphate uridylyltransferase
MSPQVRRDADFQPELRKNIITREWVIIASGRSKRPSDFAGASPPLPPLPSHDPGCPFCAGNEAETPPELFALRADGKRNGPGWSVRVVPNKFPALRPDGQPEQRNRGIYAFREGVGSHEVIVEAPEHNKDLWQMEVGQVEAVLAAYQQRLLALEAQEGTRYVLIFRNRGARAGTSVSHPHSQLIAASIQPQELRMEILGAADYYEYIARCAFCDIIVEESRGDERIVLQSDHFLVHAAYAGRYPFETWILPKRHAIRFGDMTPPERADLASVLKETLTRLAICLNNPSYNFALHTAPVEEHNVRAFHWHLEVYPRLSTPGGFELGSDLYINATAPEEAARFLRECKC